MSNYYAAGSFAFCLNCAVARITDPDVLAFVHKMAPVFADFANLIGARASSGMQGCSRFVRDVVLPRLAFGCNFLLEGGFANTHAPERGLYGDGHAAALWLTPWAAGKILCAFIDRGEGLDDLLAVDSLQRPQPILMVLPTAALFTPAGHAALTALLMLQHVYPQQDVPRYADTFHASVTRLIHACMPRHVMGGPRSLG